MGTGLDWSTLIAGLGGGVIGGALTLAAGVVAYRGARGAAQLQVEALERQLADVQAARQEEEKHKREVERAYVSGGGVRLTEDRSLFELHVNNHGKTPARLHHAAYAFATRRCFRRSRHTGSRSLAGMR